MDSAKDPMSVPDSPERDRAIALMLEESRLTAAEALEIYQGVDSAAIAITKALLEDERSDRKTLAYLAAALSISNYLTEQLLAQYSKNE